MIRFVAGTMDGFYLGLKRYYTEGSTILYQRKWNGTKVPSTDPIFATGEPNNSDRFCAYANLKIFDHQGLRDKICSDLTEFICERKISSWP